MKDALSLVVRGLQCDATGCDYRDDNVRSEDYASCVGRPCPKCGASLLTPEDYEAFHYLIAAVALTNAEVGPLPETGGHGVLVPLEMDGSGTVRFPDDFEATR